MYKMASFAAATTSYDVVFSYQGAFGPPTYGHYKSMEAFADNLTREFPNNKILMLFMPTAGGSKTHLLPTRSMRKNVLDMFCTMLTSKNPNITFETSQIENEIFDAEVTKKKTATIYTINKLKAKYPTSTICLGMGLDNAYQLPYWEDIDKYVDLVHKIYVVPREPSKAELENTRMFIVENTDGSTVKMQFDVTVPSWTKETFLKCFFPSDHIETKGSVTKENLISKLTSDNNYGGEPYKFFQKLPPVVELTSEESAASASAASTPKLSIPATSSSMMRYFIGQYLQEIDTENNLIKIQKLMFGPDPLTEEQRKLVDETIVDYKDNDVFKGTFPADADVKDKNEKKYNDQYESIGFSGGNRKTKRRRTNKKRRSQRKKRRSQKK
jgi:nicotinic acid mononucleotide adenylyltransferase